MPFNSEHGSAESHDMFSRHSAGHGAPLQRGQACVSSRRGKDGQTDRNTLGGERKKTMEGGGKKGGRTAEDREQIQQQ